MPHLLSTELPIVLHGAIEVEILNAAGPTFGGPRTEGDVVPIASANKVGDPVRGLHHVPWRYLVAAGTNNVRVGGGMSIPVEADPVCEGRPRRALDHSSDGAGAEAHPAGISVRKELSNAVDKLIWKTGEGRHSRDRYVAVVQLVALATG